MLEPRRSVLFVLLLRELVGADCACFSIAGTSS